MVTQETHTKQHTLKLIAGGKDYFTTLVNMLHLAVDTIYIQTYIFNDDETGKLVTNALIEAANRNVKVYVLVDGFASQGLGKTWIKNISNHGIQFHFFEPIFKSSHYYFGRRMHQKVICIDAKFVLIGGMNIADRYNDLPHRSAWLDFAVKIEGKIVSEITTYCKAFWDQCVNSKNNLNITSISALAVDKQVEKNDVRLRINDWTAHKNEISNTYLEMFRYAKKDIVILCSYFIPGKAIRRAMAAASKRGICIKIITAGPTDIYITKLAERWLYDWLLRHQIVIYEYQKNVLHGKLAVCDQAWTTIGSYNINNISAYASVELNVDIYDQPFALQVIHELNEIIAKDCVAITKHHHQHNNNWIKQCSRWISFYFIQSLFMLFTFYFKRRLDLPKTRLKK